MFTEAIRCYITATFSDTMVQGGNLALGRLPPTESLLNPAGAPTFCKQVLSTHLVITIQLVPEKDTDKVSIQLLQC